jgi:hypothetical protein
MLFLSNFTVFLMARLNLLNAYVCDDMESIFFLTGNGHNHDGYYCLDSGGWAMSIRFMEIIMESFPVAERIFTKNCL